MLESARLFDGQLDLPPGAGDAPLSQIPARRGLALLSAEGGGPILLLPAADLRARVTGRLRNPDAEERRRMPDLAAVTRRVQWRLANSHFETDLRFLEIARALWPDAYADLLAWKPAWFVRVDLGADYPHFQRTQEIASRGEGVPPLRREGISPSPRGCGQPGGESLFGPFPGGGSAQKFLSALADAFELCRDLRCLRQSPHGRRCSYGQMGKCLCPCDGTTPSADYRGAVAEAAEFVAGARRPVMDRIAGEMKRAAAQLQFERAAALKARLERLAALEGPDYAFVAPIEEFRFLLIQRGPSRKRLCAFLADSASIRPAGEIGLPAKTEQVRGIVEAALGTQRPSPFPAAENGDGPCLPDKWAVGLVAHYLYASPRRRGLILPLREGVTAEGACEAIQEAGESLGIKKPGPETPPPP